MQDIWQEADKAVKEKNIPIEIVLELTRRCNLECCHCCNIKDNAELSFTQIKKIVEQLRRAGCLFLILTGGEVFTKADFLEIASFIRSSGLDIKIFTNGTLITPKIVKELKKLYPSEVGISIQGAKASTHDRITGVDGSFEKALSGVKMLKEEGVSVYIKCTVMKDNFCEYRGVIELAKKLEVTCMMGPVISPKDDGSREVLAHRLTLEKLEGFYREQFSQLEREKIDKEFSPCEAGRTFGGISAVGDVYPCIQLPLKVGNIFEKEFKNIWVDSFLLNKMRQTKQEDIRFCNTCELAQYCSRCPGLAYLEDGDLFGPSNVACFSAGAYKRFQKKKVI